MLWVPWCPAGEVWVCSAYLSKPFLASRNTVPFSFCIRYPANITMELPRWLSGKESACQCRRCGFNPWVGMIPGGGNGNPLQYSCLENHHGQRSLVGYSPWSCKELDMTEWLSTHTHTYTTLLVLYLNDQRGISITPFQGEQQFPESRTTDLKLNGPRLMLKGPGASV